MLLNRDEYVGARNSYRVNGHGSDLKMIQQAAVKAELLTGDPVWDLFLTYLQHALEETETYRQRAQDMLTHPNTVDHNIMLQAKIALAESTSRASILEAVISLPKDLIELGSEANSLLERAE
ncbi:MAG TPA: hypothetical protein ENH84_07770 [Phycisphaerae bacterium]|nr:hypothetical protein [Phycisphaerae bacterium]